MGMGLPASGGSQVGSSLWGAGKEEKGRVEEAWPQKTGAEADRLWKARRRPGDPQVYFSLCVV